VLALVLKTARFTWGRAIEGGLLMGQGGEFAFIVTGYAVAHHLFAPALGQFVLLVVTLSMFATPLVARAAQAWGQWWERTHQDAEAPLDQATPAALKGHVIIVGFGRIGQLLAKLLAHKVCAMSPSKTICNCRLDAILWANRFTTAMSAGPNYCIASMRAQPARLS